MSRRKRFSLSKQNPSFSLNITSMTDMFTILLVFLLQSFAAGEVNLDPVEGLRLPSSSSEKNPVFGVKISLSRKALLIDEKILANVENDLIENAAIDPKDTNFIKPLFDELQKINKEDEKMAKTGKVLFQADESVPYATLRKVMYTASMAGFPNLKIVTTVRE